MTTRRELLQGAGAIGLASAVPLTEEAQNLPLYSGVRYQSWTPLAPFDHVMFIQRFEGRETHEFRIVGASLHNGPWFFISDHEADNHVQAIWNAALIEQDRVRLRHRHSAEKAIAIHQSMGLGYSPDLIRAHYERMGETQIKAYAASVMNIMAERRKIIGPSHPTMALELYSRFQNSVAMV